jgi:protoheme IX farnesyltransferase
VRDLVALLKMRQTVLLLVTAVGAYALTLPTAMHWGHLALATAALFLAIGGATALNMVFDRDVDAAMARTAGRPIPSGTLPARTALWFGLAVSLPGLLLAWVLRPLFGALVTLGFVLDAGVYTAWLKRRTPHSILLGGISGGIPALAARTLALGRVDLVGILLAAAVVLWIPAHILSLTIRQSGDYRAAGIPVWPNVYGVRATQRLIAAGCVLNSMTLIVCGYLLSIGTEVLAALALSGVALIVLAATSLVRPSDRNNWRLFKLASIYMALSFALLTLGAVVR